MAIGGDTCGHCCQHTNGLNSSNSRSQAPHGAWVELAPLAVPVQLACWPHARPQGLQPCRGHSWLSRSCLLTLFGQMYLSRGLRGQHRGGQQGSVTQGARARPFASSFLLSSRPSFWGSFQPCPRPLG